MNDNKAKHMATATISRSEVLSLAWQIRKEEGLSFSESQKAAWKSVRLRTALKKGPVAFSYTKENGEVRKAMGTTNTNLFRYENKGGSQQSKAIVVKYYDFEVGGWRSCRADRLLAA